MCGAIPQQLYLETLAETKYERMACLWHQLTTMNCPCPKIPVQCRFGDIRIFLRRQLYCGYGDCLARNCSNSIANALGLLQLCVLIHMISSNSGIYWGVASIWYESNVIFIFELFWYWNRNNLSELVQYYGYCCPGSLHRQNDPNV